MSNPAQDPDSLLARRARRWPEASETQQAPEPRMEPQAKATPQGPDADMLEFVAQFEQKYAELAPPRDDVQRDADFAADLFPEFPESFDAPPARSRPRALELARVEPDSVRDWSRTTALQREAQAEADSQLDIDEAFSILHAAEASGARAAQRAADDEQAAAQERALPTSDVQPQYEAAPKPSPLPTRGVSEQVNWTTKSHKPHSIAVVAAVVALVVGVATGYVAGRSPRASSAKIETSQQGVPHLRLDTELRKR